MIRLSKPVSWAGYGLPATTGHAGRVAAVAMTFDLGDGRLGLRGAGSTDSHRLRIMAANAARLRLAYQLDFRLDTTLDPDGFHVITAVSTDEDGGPFDFDSDDEWVVRCRAMLKFLGVTAPFEMRLDFRLRDYLTLDPAGGAEALARADRLRLDVPVSRFLPDAHTPGQPA